MKLSFPVTVSIRVLYALSASRVITGGTRFGITSAQLKVVEVSGATTSFISSSRK